MQSPSSGKILVLKFLNISEIFHEIFHAKNFHEILHHYLQLPTVGFEPRSSHAAVRHVTVTALDHCEQSRYGFKIFTS